MILGVRISTAAVLVCLVGYALSYSKAKVDDKRKPNTVTNKTSQIKHHNTNILRSQGSKMNNEQNLRRREGLNESIKMTDENVKGYFTDPKTMAVNVLNNNEIKRKSNSVNHGNIFAQENKDGTITGVIEENNGNLKGTIIIPNISDAQGNKKGTLTGVIEENNDNLKETINIPDEHFAQENKDISLPDIIEDGNEDLQGASNFSGENPEHNNISGVSISGIIKEKDGNIEGTINIPDKYLAQGNIDEVITGVLEETNDNVEGTINILDEHTAHGNDEGYFIGIVEESNENIEGTIFVPSDGGGLSEEIKIGSKDNMEEEINVDLNEQTDDENDEAQHQANSCWMNINSKKYLVYLNRLDAKFRKAREQYQTEIGPEFDRQMMEVLVSSQGKAPRAVHQAGGDPAVIPAGLSLGGHAMLRMRGSVLFFHRLKLRNSTRFQVNFLQANLTNMVLIARLSLNDIHLRGAYERATTQQDKSVLYLIPNFGEIDVLLKDVSYKLEGRLRMLNNRLLVELVNSDIVAKDVLLTYANSSLSTRVLLQDNIEDFVDRLKSDLDQWLKDYFNDYLMYFGTVGGKNYEVQIYEKQKTIKLNEYADFVIAAIKKRLRDMNLQTTKIPHFTFVTATSQQMKLKSGVLRGLDSMYRRSVATTTKRDDIRFVDTIIGFSNLKVEYKYEAMLSPSHPAFAGTLVLSADELTAKLQVSQRDYSHTVTINVDTIVQLKSETLTIEGPANRMIANFKYILENPIIAVMTNILKHNIKMLKTLPGCDPRLWGEHEPKSLLRRYQTSTVLRAHDINRTQNNKIPGRSDYINAPSANADLPYGYDEFPDRENKFIVT